MSESNRRRGFNHGEQTPLSTWSQRDSLSWEYPAVPSRPARFSTATRTNLWSHGYYLYWKDAHCGVLPARAYSLLPDGKPAQLHEPRGRRRAHLRQPARPFIAGAQWQPGVEIDIGPDLQALPLRVTMKLLVDIDMVNQSIASSQIIEDLIGNPVGVLEGLLNLQIDLPVTPYGQRMAAKRKADAFIYNLIDQRLADKCDVGDILSILLQVQDKHDDDMLTREQVRDELVSLIAAGHETTTNTITWTFYLLSEHPTVLEKVLAELQDALAGRNPQAGDLSQLTYLDWVVKESMRLYPSAWTQGRRAVGAFDLDGYHFPAGTLIMISQWVLHRLPDIWGDPQVFRPERWDPVNGQKVPQWAYFPFGGGSRICIGMPLAQLQVRLVLATILQRYIPCVVPGHPVVPLPLITLRVKHGLPVKLEPTPQVW